jgi:hypothetical protein
MSTTKSPRINIVVMICLLSLVTPSIVISVNTVIAMANSDEAARRSSSTMQLNTGIIANETAPKGMSLTQLDRLAAHSVQDEMLGTKATRRTTKATRCPTKSKAELEDFKKSQFGEDEKLLGYFNGLCGGSYIEMGALGGLKYSNSHVFNKALDWKGLLVELSPSNYEKLVKNRRNEIAVVHAAVCANHQTVHYMAVSDMNPAVGGIWEFAAPSFRKKWWKNVSLDALPTIECSPLKDILVEHVAKEAYFDFLVWTLKGPNS